MNKEILKLENQKQELTYLTGSIFRLESEAHQFNEEEI